MIFAVKLTKLRKRMGISQEELAASMNVSRQSVSKWESGQSIPDLEKIIQLSLLFGVSTDYLLKDDLETLEVESGESLVKVITKEEVEEYLEANDKSAVKFSIAVFLCIMSPVLLIVLSILSSCNLIDITWALIIGLSSLFLLVTVAVIMLITTDFSLEKYKKLLIGDFTLEFKASKDVVERKTTYQQKYNKFSLIAIVLCILSPVALIISAILNNMVAISLSLGFLFLVVAVAAYILVLIDTKYSLYQKLLQEGKYSKNYSSKKIEINGIFWVTTTALYVLLSIIFNCWDISWVIWIIATLIYMIIVSKIKK